MVQIIGKPNKQNMKKLLFILSIFISLSVMVKAQSVIKFSHKDISDSAIVYLPAGYDTSIKYPILILEVGKKDTTNVFIPTWLRDKPYIIAFPKQGQGWGNSKRKDKVIDYLINNYSVDTTAMFIQNR